ncbi:MAG: EF-hand domain-containing protein [Methylophilaceae bacterium]|nr:EF-hand domain-containing protein [Methylophilaceae bacterium]
MTIKTKHAALLSTLLSMALISMPAFSADIGTGGYSRQLQKMSLMKMIDSNSDHMVTAAEFDAFNNAVFDELDTDKDGSLDEKEWVGTKPSKAISVATGGYSRELRKVAMMDAMDANHDHKVTRDEFLNYQRTIFQKMDASGDKQLDGKEWLAKQVG